MLKVFDFEKTPIVDIVNEILVDASSRGASDIHFDPKDNILQIRIRIDGELVDYATVPEEYIKNLITRIKIISGMNITESRLPQDGAIKGVVKDIELDLRVSSINTNKGEKIVIRILDYTLSLNGIEKLGFSDYNYKKVLEMIGKPNGIILVTGATGTGKTTTVYSMLQKLSNDTTNIMSIEDPVEMDLDNVNQIQVNADIGLTFATALRSVLRQDPNIIMIGEIRDSETATIAIRASVTGHLVLSTLHTNDSLSTIERLLDMDVEKYLLAEALEGIISQKLARRLCPHCKKLRNTTTYEKELIKKTLNMDIDEIYEAVGCEHCNHGYKGRIAFQEVLTIDQKIQDALSMNIRKDKLRNLVYNDSVITLLQDGMIKVIRGETTIEELLRLVEFDENAIITFNLSKDILDNELNKILEYQDDIQKQDNNNGDIQNSNIIEDEIIVPDVSDVIIDSIDDTYIEDNIDIDNDNIINMDSLDNDENVIDKIEDVISEKQENKKSSFWKKKKDKKKKKENEIIVDETNDNDGNINNDTIVDTTNKIEDAQLDTENMESLDNDTEFTNKIEDAISGTAKNLNQEVLETNVNNENETIQDVQATEKKSKAKKKKKKNLKKDTKNIEKATNDTVEYEVNTSDTTLDEVKKDNSIINDDTTFVTKIENLVKAKKKNNNDIDIIDEISQDNELYKKTTNENIQDEITDNDIAELEEVIESIKTNETKPVKEDSQIPNNENIENTIKISIKDNENTDEDINVSEVKTINMVEKDDDEMETLDYNTNFIDKLYDSINFDEKRIIEKDNIDYEKIERLGDIQDEIGSRVSRMLNKKRYKKIKK